VREYCYTYYHGIKHLLGAPKLAKGSHLPWNVPVTAMLKLLEQGLKGVTLMSCHFERITYFLIDSSYQL
jgi:hypothetical protein